MKNLAVNTLNYAGVVTLSRYNKGKKVKICQVHNAGGEVLFNFLADCLAGDFDLATYNKPVKISLIHVDTETNTITKASEDDYFNLLSKPEKVYEPGAGKVRYSFMIPQDTVIKQNWNAIGLYADSAEKSTDLADYAAYCMLHEDIAEQTTAITSVLVIDWDLIISNKETLYA